MRIVLLDDYQGVSEAMGDWSRIKAQGHQVSVLRQHVESEDELARQIADAEVLVMMRERTTVGRSLMSKLPRLRLIVSTGMANAALDLKAAAERGIVCCGTASSRFATAELTMALILALARQIVPQHNAVREGRWQEMLGEDINGRTLGIVGLGNLGARVVGYAKAFGMVPIAWSQNLTEEAAQKAGATRVAKDELFARADYISVHYKLSKRSQGIVGAADIARMKRTAYLINTSRGPLVDEAALVAALNEGRIAGAALDVFDIEPLPKGHVLTRTPRLLLTPHVGYVSRQNYETYYREIVENIEGWLAGKPPRVMT